MYVWPQLGSRSALSMGILPSINVRMPRAVIPARLAMRRFVRAQQSRDRLRRGGGLTGFGALPVGVRSINPRAAVITVGTTGMRPCPQIVPWIPPGCTSQVTYDANGCAIRTPVCISSPITSTPSSSGTGPVPAGFPTNQIFVNTDGSQWIYSAAQRQWVNVGTPYNVNAAGTAPSTTTTSTTSSGTPTAAAPVVNVTPSSSDSYSSILSFLTQSSLIPNVPNWLIGLGALLLVKKVSSSNGSKKNPRRRR